MPKCQFSKKEWLEGGVSPSCTDNICRTHLNLERSGRRNTAKYFARLMINYTRLIIHGLTCIYLTLCPSLSLCICFVLCFSTYVLLFKNEVSDFPLSPWITVSIHVTFIILATVLMCIMFWLYFIFSCGKEEHCKRGRKDEPILT